MTPLRARLLSHIYLLPIVVTVPLLCLVSRRFRRDVAWHSRGSARRYVRFLRMIARDGARTLGLGIFAIVLAPLALAMATVAAASNSHHFTVRECLALIAAGVALYILFPVINVIAAGAQDDFSDLPRKQSSR